MAGLIAVWDTPDSYGDSFVRESIITDISDKGIVAEAVAPRDIDT